jgi:transposase
MEDVKSRPESNPSCPNCAKLETLLAQALGRIAELEARVAELEERLRQNSKNSHRPPSSDSPGTAAKARKPKSGRKRGGQIGHEGARRDLFPPEEVDQFVHHRAESCEKCHATLPTESRPGDPPPERHQITELPEKLFEVIEHQAHTVTCEHCGHVSQGESRRSLHDRTSGLAWRRWPRFSARPAM